MIEPNTCEDCDEYRCLVCQDREAAGWEEFYALDRTTAYDPADAYEWDDYKGAEFR